MQVPAAYMQFRLLMQLWNYLAPFNFDLYSTRIWLKNSYTNNALLFLSVVCKFTKLKCWKLYYSSSTIPMFTQ